MKNSNSPKVKKICITGGRGFIGSNLINHLRLNPGIEVVVFKGDLLSQTDLENFFHEHQSIDQVVSLVGAFDGDFSNLLKINAVALENLLSAVVPSKIKKIIHISTGAVYGEPIENASVESDPTVPNTLYGVSKLCGEQVVECYRQSAGLQAIVLRFSNVYSEDQGRGVINAFLKGIKEHKEISIRGDGTQSRNFLHVKDACKAIELAIFYNQSGIFNISNPKKVSINDIVKLLKKRYKFRINHLPADNNLKDLLLNIDKSKRELGFDPKVDLTEL